MSKSIRKFAVFLLSTLVLFTFSTHSLANGDVYNIRLRVINHGQDYETVKSAVKRLVKSTELIYSQCRPTNVEIVEQLDLESLRVSLLNTENPFGITSFFTETFYEAMESVFDFPHDGAWNVHIVDQIDFQSPGWNIGALLKGYVEIQGESPSGLLLNNWKNSEKPHRFLPKDVYARTILLALGSSHTSLVDASLAHELGHGLLETYSRNHQCNSEISPQKPYAHKCTNSHLMGVPVNSVSLEDMERGFLPLLTWPQCLSLLEM